MLMKSFLIHLLFGTLTISCSSSTIPVDQMHIGHFDYVLYDGLPSSGISDISDALESNHERITHDLHVQDMPRVTVKIWSNYDHFLNDMESDIGTRYTGATGYIYSKTELRIFYDAQVSHTAVHEFAHLVSMQLNDSIVNNPRWLWEAVALYESREFIDPRTLPYMMSGDYPTLSELNSDYNSSNHDIYSVGYTLTGYIIDTWGMDAVIALIRNNGNISVSLGLTTQEYETGWYQYVVDTYLTTASRVIMDRRSHR